jgi:hypothetical protein
MSRSPPPKRDASCKAPVWFGRRGRQTLRMAPPDPPPCKCDRERSGLQGVALLHHFVVLVGA